MGFFEDILGGPKYMEPSTSKAARRRLYELGTQEAPTQPVQQVALADPLQQQAYNLASQYAGGGLSPAYNTALGLMTQYATQPVDVTAMPGFQGIWDKVLSEGSRSSRNLQRALKLSGNAATNTSKGRDIMGRQQSDVEAGLMAAALPFLQQAESQRFQAGMALPQLAQQQENAALSRINAGTQAGSMMRMIQQAINDAQYNAAMNDLFFKYETQPGLLQSTLVNPSLTQKTGWLTGTNQVLSGMGELAGNIAGLVAPQPKT